MMSFSHVLPPLLGRVGSATQADMLKTTLSRSSLLRARRPLLRPRHVAPQSFQLTFGRLSSTDDSRPKASPASNESVFELPPPPAEASGPSSTAQSSSSDAVSQPQAETRDPSSSSEASADPRVSSEARVDAQQSHTPPAQQSNVIDVEEVKERLRSLTESTAAAVRDKADRYTAAAATIFAQLGRELNKVTGYGEIESLKRQVAEQEQRIKVTRETAREAKAEYERAVIQRAKSQRDVNDLLSRKGSWTDEDVVRFTALVRQDHVFEQAETSAKLKVEEIEDAVEREFSELMRAILNRYHEEQVWSDKIRSASTYGSLTVLGLNMLVFLLAIIVVEPWKRKRLAQTFEKKVEELSGETLAAFEARHEELATKLRDQDKTLAQLVEVVAYSMQPAVTVPASGDGASSHHKHVVTQDVVSPYLPISREHLYSVAASAAVAGAVGWLAGAWFGS